MIRINQIKLPIDHKEAALEKKIKKALHNTEYKQYKIVKRSIDARKKEELSYVYAVDVTLGKGQEEKFLKKNKNRNIMAVKEKKFEFPENRWFIRFREGKNYSLKSVSKWLWSVQDRQVCLQH